MVTVQRNLLKKKTPTGIVEETTNRYDQGSVKKEVKFEEEYTLVDCEEKQVSEYVLLSQEIIDDDSFHLAEVIAAINPATRTAGEAKK
jgi:hypothetical protein